MPQQITYLFLETHSLAEAIEFWRQMDYEVDLDLGKSSRMVNGRGGPALFLTEKPLDHPCSTQIALRTDEEGWMPGAPVEVIQGWHSSHWGTQVMRVQDPDGREMLLQLGGE